MSSPCCACAYVSCIWRIKSFRCACRKAYIVWPILFPISISSSASTMELPGLPIHALASALYNFPAPAGCRLQSLHAWFRLLWRWNYSPPMCATLSPVDIPATRMTLQKDLNRTGWQNHWNCAAMGWSCWCKIGDPSLSLKLIRSPVKKAQVDLVLS